MAKVENADGTAVAADVKVNRLADLTGGMGRKLEDIKGQAVTVTGLEFETREVHKLDPEDGHQLKELESKAVAFIHVEDGTDDGSKYYTFSDPLISKLKEVSAEDLPATAVFDIKDIAGGRRVWTIS